jgi:hypothetical protein
MNAGCLILKFLPANDMLLSFVVLLLMFIVDVICRVVVVGCGNGCVLLWHWYVDLYYQVSGCTKSRWSVDPLNDPCWMKTRCWFITMPDTLLLIVLTVAIELGSDILTTTHSTHTLDYYHHLIITTAKVGS